MARKARLKSNSNVVLPGKIGNKVRPTLPGRTSGAGSSIPNDANPSSLNQSIQDFRSMSSAVALLRRLAEEEGAFSFAVFSYVQTAMSDYTITAYDTSTGQFSLDGTMLAQQIVSRMDTLHDYSVGFSDKKSIDTLIETMLKDVALSGGVAGELILDAQRLPDRIETIGYENLKWVIKNDGIRVYPQQTGSGDQIDLDIPNFFVAEQGKGSDKAYATSFLLAAVKQIFYYSEFIEDMRRVVRRAGHTRMVFQLNYEKVASTAPEEVKRDPERMKAFLDNVRDDFSKALDDLEPEDAVVCYDFADFESIDTAGEKADYKQIMEAIQSMVATSIKTHPSILGLRLGGSQSLSNTESLMFIKGARTLQRPVETILSRALTLSTRLYGSDIYVQFEFKPIDLRPEQELESFRTQRQQNIKDALSMGWVTDDEAAHILGYGPRAPGAPNLSGTLFYKGGEAQANASKATPNSDPQGRALQPDTPKKAGGESQ